MTWLEAVGSQDADLALEPLQGLDSHPNLDQVLLGTARWQAAIQTELKQHERLKPEYQGRLQEL